AFFLPAVQHRLMLPLVWGTSENQRLLFPDTAAGKIKSGIYKSFSKVQPLGVCVEHIDRSIVSHCAFCVLKGGKEKIIKGSVIHIVVFDFSCGTLVIYIVGRVGNYKIGFNAVHKKLKGFLLCGVAAHKSVSAQS